MFEKPIILTFSFIFCLVLSSCANPQNDDDFGNIEYSNPVEIEGYSPIEKMIPDFELGKYSPFTSTRRLKNGKETVLHDYGQMFDCKKQNYPVSFLQPNGDGRYITQTKPHEGVRVPPEFHNTLENIFEANKDRFVFSPTSPVDIELIPDGVLIAYSFGEWGGALIEVKSDGTHRILSRSNTNDILKVGDKIYTAHGVDHLMTDPEFIMVHDATGQSWLPEILPTPSAVLKLAEQGGVVAGLLNSGLVYIEPSGAVHYRRFGYSKPIGFRPTGLGFLTSGDVYVLGDNIIGIYSNLPNIDRPQLYVPNACDFVFGDIVEE